ncbi:hypothetical protein GCM10008935_28880 [Alkalibacillus silvisoli]|uniref:Uncharacterized protein n=1 Tax=Alkalibacillus silvisoli TaxID=392823 RepID=A0ABN1A9R7_9BACI
MMSSTVAHLIHLPVIIYVILCVISYVCLGTYQFDSCIFKKIVIYLKMYDYITIGG